MQKSITSKALSLLLALVMAMTMGVTVFASAGINVDPSGGTINLNDGTDVIGSDYDPDEFEVTVEIENTGTEEIADLTIELDETDDWESFELGGTLSEATFATEATTSFTVKPVAGLDHESNVGGNAGDGTYTATINITGTTGIEEEITVTFTVTEATDENDATLSALTYLVDGGSATPVPNFSASTISYDVELPHTTAATASVTVSGTPTNEEASAPDDTIDLVAGAGSAEVVVTAEDGQTEKTYTVNFTTADAPGPGPGPKPDPKPDPAPNTGSSSGGSSGGGGGGGGSTAPAAPPKSANVSADGSVNSTTVVNDLKKALSTSTDTAVVTVKNAESISAAAIKSLANAAAAAGKDAVVQADTTNADGSIQGRLYIDTAKLAGMSGSLKLSVETQGQRPESRKMLFEKYYNNKVAVVSFGQQGGFGTRLKVAAKLQLPAKTDSLIFYSYDAATNKFTKIETSYRIDKKGFIHFETQLAGDIIISDKPLQKK